MKLIVNDNLTVNLEKKRIKNMYLKVLAPDANVAVTAPIGMSEKEIRDFIISKLGWIQKQQERMKERHPGPELNYDQGDPLLIWGDNYILRIADTLGRSRVERTEDALTLYIRPESTREQRKRKLESWYREELIRILPALIAEWETRIGVKSSGYSIRNMKTRWGSCNVKTKNICINLQLVTKDPCCLEYVVVHELVHLLERSHNQVFKAYLDHYLPQWRSIRAKLRT